MSGLTQGILHHPSNPHSEHISKPPTMTEPTTQEPEPHHPDSDYDDSDSLPDQDTNALALPPTTALLPAEILKPLPSPARSLQSLPWDRMTRGQKRAERNRSRAVKKEVWMRLREGVRGRGVVEAGRAARVRRGVGGGGITEARGKGRVRRRAERGERVKVSGRERLVGERVRRLGGGDGLGVGGKRTTARTKTRVQTKPKG